MLKIASVDAQHRSPTVCDSILMVDGLMSPHDLNNAMASTRINSVVVASKGSYSKLCLSQYCDRSLIYKCTMSDLFPWLAQE